MSEKREPPKEEKTKVPSYIVTFSDMITLLLTFFVLLLSMSSTRIDNAKFERGREAFVKSLTNFGLNGISFSQKKSLSVGSRSTLNKVDKNEEFTEQEALDMTEETIRRIFKELEKRMKITPAQIIGKSPDFRPTSIKFRNGEAVLNKPGVKYLEKFAYNLQQNIGSQSLTIYVVGMARNEKSFQEQCVVSANRAQAAADQIRKSLPKDTRWKIYSWGAGSGGQWKSSGPIEESEVVIAVLGN